MHMETSPIVRLVHVRYMIVFIKSSSVGFVPSKAVYLSPLSSLSSLEYAQIHPNNWYSSVSIKREFVAAS